MASSSHQNNNNQHNNNVNMSSCASNSTSDNTTFVQLTDPSNFRSIVQKLTGSTTQESSVPSRHLVGKSTLDKGPRRSSFKLHERRQHSATRKLEILTGQILSTSTTSSNRQRGNFLTLNKGEMVMASPVSPFEMMTRGSPRSPMEEAEERAIAEKGFYLHPSPLSTPRGSEPPELLPLFPLQSPNATSTHLSSS